MKTVALKLVRPALAALLLALAFVPGTANAYRVFFGYGYPYYYRPPVVYVPPPVYYAPPPVYYAPPVTPPVTYAVPPAYAPRPYTPGRQLSTRCNAGAYICPLPAAAPVGGNCSCPANGFRANGRIG